MMFLKSILIDPQNNLKSPSEIVNHMMDESENNGYDLDLGDFDCDCVDRSSQVHRH